MGNEMQTELVRATLTDQARLENLMELYVHDFSEILGMTPQENGRFGYPRLSLYWGDPRHFPFLIRAGGQLAGFALVAQGSQVSGDPAVFDVAEFFVVRGVRRHGMGWAAALQVFATFPGTWEVRVMEENTGAQVFWKRVVDSFTKGDFEAFMWRSGRGKNMHVFRFSSPEATGG